MLLALLDGDATTQQSDDRGAGSSRLPENRRDDPMRQFVSVVLADTEDVWHQVFKSMGRTYDDPKLVLYSSRVSSACGLASAASGPFYCPEDQKAYLDLSFFQEMKDRLHAPGEFAQAYVIAHEIGYHVQNELGILGRAAAERARSDQRRSNAISVRVELQADCFAGAWAYHADRTKHIIEQGDVAAMFEDVHWIDPTSHELLDLMVEQVRRLPVLLVITFRSEFQHGWGGRPHVTMLALNRLGERETGALVRSLAGNAPLGSDIVEDIVERTDGVPLFVEELTKAVIERGGQDNRVAAVMSASPLPALAVPSTWPIT